MAGLASGIAENILQKLKFLAHEEFGFVFHIKSKLTKLEGTVTTIKAVLLDAEEKQASSRALSIWLSQLRDIFYDFEDVLDEVECQVLRKQVVTTYGSTSRKVCDDFFSYFPALAFRSQLGHKIKNIRERLGNIAAKMDQLNLVERVEDRYVMHGKTLPSTSLAEISHVVGRDDDKKNIVSLLMQPDSSRNVNVIPIVGFGGLGKTTIAQLVYNDERVDAYFELRIWVCVSEDFDVSKLIRKIMISSSDTIDENLGVDLWKSSLQNYLKNKKFLLVLDDVWNEDSSKWIELEVCLSGASEGSKILVTTRSHLVASIVGTVPTYTLEGLCHDDCLTLFVKCAFKEGEDKHYPNLLEIGNEIVKKCKGIPLAIRTLGFLLYSKCDEREWKFVRDNEIWKLKQTEDGILPALKLSYDQMPSQLKQCFAFCSLFPKDHWFHSGELVAFWMAHGLLNSNGQNLELEDVGDMCIKDLLSRSFFQEVEDRVCHYEFKMHDLVHDLALMVAQEECSTVDFHTQNIAGTVRHLSFSHNYQLVPHYLYKLSQGVRTTLFPNKQEVTPFVEACISRFKSLRILHLSDSSFEVLSSFISALQHLRYLSLARNRSIKELPNSICKLYNLQTLLLDGCWKLERLPKDIRKMINLRHLTVTTTYTYLFEDGVCCLNSLRFLGVYGCPRLEVLFKGKDGCLNNLRTLIVSYCDRLTSLTLDIKHLTTLETLVIRGCEELRLTGGQDNWDLKLSLQKLKIEYLQKLESLPQWLQGSANTLQFLSIKRCENLKALPEWLPSLKSLQTLEIISCPRLSSLPEGINRYTVLRELTIRKCPKLIRKCRDEDWSKIATLTVRLID